MTKRTTKRRSVASRLLAAETAPTPPRPHLSMFERDPEVIARLCNPALVAYLRAADAAGELERELPNGACCGTVRLVSNGIPQLRPGVYAITDRGRAVLAVIDRGRP